MVSTERVEICWMHGFALMEFNDYFRRCTSCCMRIQPYLYFGMRIDQIPISD
jgi:hypothetical protein